jgi:hypothetical protein
VHDAVDAAFYNLDDQYRIHCGEQAWDGRAAGDFVFLPAASRTATTSFAARRASSSSPSRREEDLFVDLANGVDPATITHRHGVRFLD